MKKTIFIVICLVFMFSLLFGISETLASWPRIITNAENSENRSVYRGCSNYIGERNSQDRERVNLNNNSPRDSQEQRLGSNTIVYTNRDGEIISTFISESTDTSKNTSGNYRPSMVYQPCSGSSSEIVSLANADTDGLIRLSDLAGGGNYLALSSKDRNNEVIGLINHAIKLGINPNDVFISPEYINNYSRIRTFLDSIYRKM